MDAKLHNAMRLRVMELVCTGTFSHLSPDGRTWIDRARAQGYTAAVSENLAGGQQTAKDAVGGGCGAKDIVKTC
jgi:uncharacterized protein YkwD